MSTFAAGNFIVKLSVNLQPKLASLLWLKRSVRCFAHNADDPGFPVRYIPKKLPDVKQTKGPTYRDSSLQDGLPSSSSSNSNIRKQNMVGKPSKFTIRKSSARLSLDAESELNQEGDYGEGDKDHGRSLEEVVEELRRRHKLDQELSSSNGFLDSENVKNPEEVVQELQVYKGVGERQQFEFNQEINYDNGVIDDECMDAPDEVVEEMEMYNGGDQCKQERSSACRTKQGAQKLAIELLGKRAFTAVELRKKLTAKHFPLSIVQAVIHDFQVKGLINDRLYAETFSQSRWTSSTWGPRRIKQALLKKGVSEVDVEKAVKLVFEDGENVDQRSSLRLSHSSVEQLYVQASKQWQRSQNVPHETRKARIIRWLRYRGFDWGVVSFILRKLETQHPP